jgi:hypothetical protein
MAIARINGPMLQANLERQGTNIQIDLAAFFDVTNYRVGVNNTNPQYTLDITGNAHLGNIYILGNAITTDPGYKLNLGNISNVTISGGSPNYIIYTDGSGNLSFGNLSTLATSEVFTGNNIILGNNTVGLLSSNAGAFTTTTSITNSIAVLNQILGNITNSTGSNIIAGNVNSTLYGNVYGNVNGNNLGFFSNITAGNITSQFYGNINTDIITPYKTAVTVFNNTSAIGLPVGTSAQYPSSNIAGYFRFNSSLSTVEYYSGSSWVPFQNTISDQQITPSGSTNTYTLNQAASTSGIIVSINGTVQQPGVAYTVSGTTITFAENPQITDIIDIRFIASATAVILTGLTEDIVTTGNITGGSISIGNTNLYANTTVISNPVIPVSLANTVIDSFSTTQYRSARYTISSTNPYDSHMAEILLIQNNGIVVITVYGILNTGGNTLTYYANSSAGTANLIARGSTSSNQLRIQRTYFSI